MGREICYSQNSPADAGSDGMEYELNRKQIRTLRLTVRPPDGRVVVNAPARMSRAFVEKHNAAPVVAQRYLDFWKSLL